MKIAKPHIIIVLLLIVLSFQNSFGTTLIQQPEQIRQFDNNFKERYSGRKYNYEGKKVVNETPFGSGEYEDYKKGKPSLDEKNNSDSFTINFGAFGWLFYLVLAAAVIYLVYILFNEGGSGLFSSKQNRTLNNYEEITAENIESADINRLINNAESSNDYRLAIRYYYLLVLKNLSLKNYIKFEDDKTNADYLNEIDSTAFIKEFRYISYLFNYIWYGEFSLNNMDYKKAKNHFIILLSKVK